MIGAIQAIDPTAAALWGLFLFAAGMYPAAFMIGSGCSPCCGCPLCQAGSLPETLTVTLAGLTDKTPGPDLIGLEFNPCYGSGATARVTAPGGDSATDAGPISKVEVTNGGSGYALLGRTSPTLTISGGGGSGATFTPTLTSTNNACGVPSWSLSSVTVSGGTTYTNGAQLTITAATGDTEIQSATAIVRTGTEPTLSVEGNATATVTLVDNLDGTWGVDAITVTNGGSGYTDGDPLVINYDGDDVEVQPATGVYRTVRLQPTVSAEPFAPFSSGSDATFSVTLSPTTGPDGRAAWEIASATITAAGSGYTVGDLIAAFNTNPSGIGADGFIVGEVTAIDGSGGITGITASGGLFYDLSDELDDVEVSYAGEYYSESGIPQSVYVQSGGQYYREDASLTPYVSTVAITITQTAPSNGSGATLTAVIDSNTASGTFGQITSITITAAGDDYLAYEWRNTKCCGDFYNDMSVVVRKNNTSIGQLTLNRPCEYMHRFCGVGNRQANLGYLLVEYLGPSVPPVVTLVSEGFTKRDGTQSADVSPSEVCNLTFETEELVPDCSLWDEVGFTAAGGATATVSAGGAYDSSFLDAGGLSCFSCCKGDSEVPSEIEAEVSGTDADGTYVMQAVLNSLFPGQGTGGFPFLTYRANTAQASIRVSLQACSSHLTNDGFLPDAYGCDDCHSKCRVLWEFAVPPNCVYGNASFLGDVGVPGGGIDACGICESTPICDLRGRTLSSSAPYAPCGTASVVLS